MKNNLLINLQRILAGAFIAFVFYIFTYNPGRFLGGVAGSLVDPVAFLLIVPASVLLFKVRFRFFAVLFFALVLAVVVYFVVLNNTFDWHREIMLRHSRPWILEKAVFYITGVYVLYFLRYVGMLLCRKEKLPEVGKIRDMSSEIFLLGQKLIRLIKRLVISLKGLRQVNNLLMLIVFLLFLIVLRLYW